VGYQKERASEREPDPILKLRHARLKAKKVIERGAAEKDGTKFAPQVAILWRILNDGKNGEHNDVEIWDKYSFVKSFEDDSKFVIREDTRIGDLAAFVADAFYDGADFFEEDVDIDFETDLDGVEVVASLEPRQFKNEPPTGTRTKSTTLQLAERAEKAASGVRHSHEPAPQAADKADLVEFDDIPF
jgi:hypothetical protein